MKSTSTLLLMRGTGKINAREGGSWRFLPPPNTAKRIMLPNEVFALACRARYEEIGLVVDATNGEFAHCPYPEGMGDSGYYLLHDDHQHQGLLQSKDVGKLCFWIGHARQWLLKCDPIPANYFELWNIYEEYCGHNFKEFHEEKDENGKSVNALRAGHRGGTQTTKQKDGSGKSVNAVKAGVMGAATTHSIKDEYGRSVTGVMGSTRLNAKKDEFGRSVNGVRTMERLNAEKDEEGKSVIARKAGRKAAEVIHKEKDEKGKSVHAVSSGKKAHENKNENGKSAHAVKISSQVWESAIDGFRSNAGNVARHNKANGWDPKAKVKVEAS